MAQLVKNTRPPCPSPSPEAYSNSCPSSRWCHPTISSSVVPFSSHLQSFPVSGSLQMSQFFASGGQNIGVWASASILPMKIEQLLGQYHPAWVYVPRNCWECIWNPWCLSLGGVLLGTKSGRVLSIVLSFMVLEHFYQIHFAFMLIKRAGDVACKQPDQGSFENNTGPPAQCYALCWDPQIGWMSRQRPSLASPALGDADAPALSEHADTASSVRLTSRGALRRSPCSPVSWCPSDGGSCVHHSSVPGTVLPLFMLDLTFVSHN